MYIHPISNSNTRPAFSGKNTTFLELINRNYTTDVKNVANKIISIGKETETAGTKATYVIFPNGAHQQSPAADMIKGCMQVVIDRTKKLIDNIKIFSYKNPEHCLENTSYTYNRKGQIVRAHKQTLSPNKIAKDIKINIKYDEDSIIMTKNINNGSEEIKTVITVEDGKKLVLKSGRKNNNVIEQFKYKEGETLYSSSGYEHSKINFEAYGDPATGEMIFSSDKTNQPKTQEYIEQLSDGNYVKQIFLKNGDVITKDIPPSLADNFIHQKLDLITPQNEIVTRLEEFGFTL